MVAGHIARLPDGAKVLELGAGTSDVENLVKTFTRTEKKNLKVEFNAVDDI